MESLTPQLRAVAELVAAAVRPLGERRTTWDGHEVTVYPDPLGVPAVAAAVSHLPAADREVVGRACLRLLRGVSLSASDSVGRPPEDWEQQRGPWRYPIVVGGYHVEIPSDGRRVIRSPKGEEG